MVMRTWLLTLPVLIVCALSAAPAAAQARLDCSALPQDICLNEEILALESERVTLVEQIVSVDPQSSAAADEQSWLDGLGACGEDPECYRAAYLDHNQMLRQAVAPAGAEAPLEAPADAPTVEEQTSALDEVQAERLREAAREQRESEPRAPEEAYVASSLPGWGFFAAIGVTLLIWWWLVRARARNRDALRADEARLRDEWR
jgi:hypothetical protein